MLGAPPNILSQLFSCLTALAKTFKVMLSHYTPHNVSFSYLIPIAELLQIVLITFSPVLWNPWTSPRFLQLFHNLLLFQNKNCRRLFFLESKPPWQHHTKLSPSHPLRPLTFSSIISFSSVIPLAKTSQTTYIIPAPHPILLCFQSNTGLPQCLYQLFYFIILFL